MCAVAGVYFDLSFKSSINWVWNLTFERRPVGEVQHLLPIQQNQHNSAPIRPETKGAGVLPKWPKLAQQQACVTILWKTNLFTTCVRINFVTNCVRINLFLSPPLCHTMSGSSRRIKCRKNAHIRVLSIYPNWFSGNLTPKKPCVSVGRSLKSRLKHIYICLSLRIGDHCNLCHVHKGY